PRRAVRRPPRALPDLSGRRPQAIDPAQPDHPAVLLRRSVRLADRRLALQPHHGSSLGSPVRPGLLPARRHGPERYLLAPLARLWPAFAGQSLLRILRLPRVRLRRPWALLCNAFGVNPFPKGNTHQSPGSPEAHPGTSSPNSARSRWST